MTTAKQWQFNGIAVCGSNTSVANKRQIKNTEKGEAGNEVSIEGFEMLRYIPGDLEVQAHVKGYGHVQENLIRPHSLSCGRP